MFFATEGNKTSSDVIWTCYVIHTCTSMHTSCFLQSICLNQRKTKFKNLKTEYQRLWTICMLQAGTRHADVAAH